MSTHETIKVQQGKNVPRVDGALKVTGTAVYAGDTPVENCAFGVAVGSTIAHGKIRKIDASAAEKVPGVLGVYHHGKIGKLFRTTPEGAFDVKVDERRPPFEDDVISYYGQYVAFVVAETLEIAKAAADLVKVTYAEEKPILADEMKIETGEKKDSERGNAEAAFAAAPVKVDETYVTPVESHNPIEMHSTVAVWSDPQHLTLHESSQAIFTCRNVMAQMLGVPRQNVRVVSKFLGSGFGGKLWPWPHVALAAVTARELKRPVKVIVERQKMFMNTGHRPRTQQRIRIASEQNGHFQALMQDYVNHTSLLDDYKENCGEPVPFLYSVPNVKIQSGLARRTVGTPTSMRGPGAVPGLFALESAVDELAVKLNVDPVELRLRNEPKIDESRGKPFSSRHMRECLELGAKKFGWSKRNPKIGSMKDGAEILGWGVSAATWIASRLDADALVELKDDGGARVTCGTQDIGTGTYTVLANIVHEETGIPLERIEVQLGDTRFNQGPISGGSLATASAIPAVVQAAQGAKDSLLKQLRENPLSPFKGAKEGELQFHEGRVGKKGGAAMTVADALKKLNVHVVTGKVSSKGLPFDGGDRTTKSFGAQFIEIGWNPDLARLRVRRVVSVMDAGRIVNFTQAKNQIEGAIVMGVGMGLFEEVHYDHRYGNPVNNNLADYVVPVHADAPHIDVSFLDYPDKALNEYGARGVGEIGLAGVAPAICAAVYHATGVRVRTLPVSIESLLTKRAMG